MNRHWRARSLNRVVRFRGDGSLISGITLTSRGLIREQHDEGWGEFQIHVSDQQLNRDT